MTDEFENEYRAEEQRGIAVEVLVAVRGSFLAFVTAMGIVFLLVAVVLSEHVPGIHHGVLSGMFAVWGASAFLYAALGHVGLRLIGYR